LVLLDLPASDPARAALDAAKVTADDMGPRTKKSRRRGTKSSPALHIVDAYAQGIAAARGKKSASSVDELVSLCWHPDTWLVDRDPRRRILRALEAAHIALPSIPLAHWDPWRPTQRLEFEREHLQPAINLLMERHPPRTHPRWGVNVLPKGRAVLIAEEGIDLEAVVTTARNETVA
jgi:hypothetical protein